MGEVIPLRRAKLTVRGDKVISREYQQHEPLRATMDRLIIALEHLKQVSKELEDDRNN